MLAARIGCSGCPEEVEVIVESLDDVDRLACECGHGYVLLTVGEVEVARRPLRLVSDPGAPRNRRRAGPDSRAAAA